MTGQILYAGLASVTLSLGSGNDLVTIQSTHDGTTAVNTGAGNDRVAVQAVSGATNINSGTGDDTIYVGSGAGLWHTTQVPAVPADANGNKFLNVQGDANAIQGEVSIDGGDGSDVVTVDDTQDAAPNTGLLTSDQIMGIFGTGGLVDYSNLEALLIALGYGGNTFTVESTHGSPTKRATTSITTGAGNDLIYVDSIDGDTTIDAGGGDDAFSVGSTTSPGNPNPIPTSTLNGILTGTLTLTGGAGANQLHAYDSGDAGSNIGRLTATTLSGLGMTLGIAYTGIQTLDVELSKGHDHFTVISTPVGSTLTLHGGVGETTATNDVNNVIDITSIAIRN